MSYALKVWYGKKFFGHLMPYYQLLAVEAVINGPGPLAIPANEGGSIKALQRLMENRTRAIQ